tara:strand:- start:508 stop:735 length:228 start_codon:yes stop_codon:yes gene_type:complete
MSSVKDMYMDEADTILSVTATRLVGGEIDEDGALKILDKNLETLSMLGIEDKYDALAVIYKMTDQLYQDVNGNKI